MIEKLSNILERFLEKRDLKKKIYEKDVILNWKKYVGNILASHIIPVNIKKGTLIVLSDHPTWSENFLNLFPEVKEKINSIYGYELINEVKVILKRKGYGRKR